MLRRESEEAREEQWKARFDELEEYDKRGRSDLLYHEVSHLTKTGKKGAKNNAAINDNSGEIRTEIREKEKEEMERLH